MKAIKIKKKEYANRRGVSLRSLGNRLDRAVDVIRRLQETPELKRSLKVRIYSNGVVMRIEDNHLKARMFNKLSLKADSQFGKTKSVYFSAVGELYVAENLDTRQAIVTAEQSVSDRAKAFYSRIGRPKYRKVSRLNTSETHMVRVQNAKSLHQALAYKPKDKS